jgi:hypothetical protein
MLQAIGLCNSSENGTTQVAIFDARPLLNAQANMVKGGGYESCGPGKNYSNCSIAFGDIENIHDVRKASEKLFSLGLSKLKGRHYHREWIQQIESTQYFQILSRILEFSNDILKTMLVDQRNILIHCSDGWDRTA